MVRGMALYPRLRTWTFQRAGQLDPNPTSFAQRSANFASAATTRYNSVSLIATRTEDGVHGYLVAPDWKGIDSAAQSLAHAVGAKAVEVDSPPDLIGPGREVVGRLDYQDGNSGGIIQAGADPAEVIRTLAHAMPMNSWVGVVMRRPTRGEHKRWFEWLNTRIGGMQSHNTRQTNYPVVTSIYAATSSHFTTRSLLNQVASTLPGFDMSVGTQIPMRWVAALAPFLLPLLLLVAHLLPGLVGQVVTDPDLVAQLPVVLTAEPVVTMENVWRGVGLAAVLSALVALGVIPSRWSRLRSALRRGTLPRPYVRIVPAKRGSIHNFQHQNKLGEYPLDKRSFMVAPHLLTTLVAPHAGAVTGASATRARAVPSVMTGRIGPLVGHADGGVPVHLSARDLQHGGAVVGRPGAGKALDLDARVPVPVCDRFPTGWARNGDLVVGDKVFAADGSLTEVVGFSDTFVGEVYELTLSDGQTVRADADHLWTVTVGAGRGDLCDDLVPALEGRAVAPEAERLRSAARALPVGSYSTARELSQVIGTTPRRVIDFADRVGISRQCEMAGAGEADRPVPHHMGRTDRPVVYPAAELLMAWADRVEARANPAAPLHVVVDTRTIVEDLRTGGGAGYSITLPGPLDLPDADLPLDPYTLGVRLAGGRPVITAAAPFVPDRPGPGGPPRIPVAYLRASRAQRLALLQGLMDSGGHVDTDGRCEFSQADRGLVVQVAELVRSLGIKVGPVRPAASDHTATRRDGHGKHRICFTTSQPVFRLPRMLDRLAAAGAVRQHLRIVGAKRVADRPVRCISVANPHATFLVEGFVPTHNSVLMSNIYAWSALERVRPSGAPGFPGRRNSLIVFEPKLDGAQEYARWARSIGDRLLVAEVANPNGLAVDLLDRPGTVLDRAEFFTEALRYAFDDGAIQGASAEALRAVLAGGMVVTDDMVDNLQKGANARGPILTIDKGRSPIYYAHVLLGSLGDDVAVALAEQVEDAAKAVMRDERDPYADVVLANGKLAPIFAGRTPAQRASYCQAPRNKLDAFASIEHFFAPHRPKVSWSRVLQEHLAIVVLTGVDSDGHMMTSYTERLMSSLLMYSLRDSIERNCSAWEHQNRWVSVFVDELSMIAGNDPEIITWLKNRGRSYGVRPVFATQFPGQLAPEVRDTFLSFSTLITFTLDSPTIAKEVVADLAGDGTDWTVGDVLELPQHHAIVRANVDRQRQPPFSFRAGYWSADEASRQQFIHDQGYGGAAPAGQFGVGFSSLPEEAA